MLNRLVERNHIGGSKAAVGRPLALWTLIEIVLYQKTDKSVKWIKIPSRCFITFPRLTSSKGLIGWSRTDEATTVKEIRPSTITCARFVPRFGTLSLFWISFSLLWSKRLTPWFMQVYSLPQNLHRQVRTIHWCTRKLETNQPEPSYQSILSFIKCQLF